MKYLKQKGSTDRLSINISNKLGDGNVDSTAIKKTQKKLNKKELNKIVSNIAKNNIGIDLSTTGKTLNQALYTKSSNVDFSNGGKIVGKAVTELQYNLISSSNSVDVNGSFAIELIISNINTNTRSDILTQYPYTIRGVDGSDVNTTLNRGVDGSDGNNNLKGKFVPGTNMVINFTINENLIENKTFIISLDGYDVSATVSLNVIETYDLSAPIEVDEGDVITVDLSTQGVDIGAQVSYRIEGVSSSDISGASLTGSFTIDENGNAQKTFNVTEDALTEGPEVFILKLDNNEDEVNVNIVDTSRLPSYNLSVDNSIVNETDNHIFIVTLVTENVNAGERIYYTMSGSGIEVNDFVGLTSLKGYFEVGTTDIITCTVKEDFISESNENILFSLDNNSDFISITIQDTSTPTYDLTSTSPVDEGDVITVNLATQGLSNGTIVPYRIEGISSSDISDASLTGNFTVGANGNAQKTFNVTEDRLSDGDKTFRLSIVGVNEYVDVTIIDTSKTPGFTLQSNIETVDETVPDNVVAITLITENTFLGEEFDYTISGDSITPDDFTGLASLNGTFTVDANGRDNVTLTINEDFITENNETLILALDNGQAQKSIIINDTSIETYDLTRNVASVDEGEDIIITLTTRGVIDNTSIPYTITGVSSNDIEGVNTSGNFIVVNNTATVTFTTTEDLSPIEDGFKENVEIFTLTLDNIGETVSVDINDTSVQTFELIPDVLSVNEGDQVTITLNTQGLSDGNVVPYTISGDGITSDDFTGLDSLDGTFTISNNTASVTLDIANDITTEGTETFTLSLVNGGASTDPITINDTSETFTMQLIGQQILDYDDRIDDSSEITSLNGDGTIYAACKYHRDGVWSGNYTFPVSVFVYKYDDVNNEWLRHGNIIENPTHAWDTTENLGYHFGRYICLNYTGDIIAVSNDVAGILYIYKFENDSWVEKTTIEYPGVGFSIAWSQDTNRVVLTEPGGLVKVFEIDTTTWETSQIGGDVDGRHQSVSDINKSGNIISVVSDQNSVAIYELNNNEWLLHGSLSVDLTPSYDAVLEYHLNNQIQYNEVYVTSLADDGYTVAVGNMDLVEIYEYDELNWNKVQSIHIGQQWLLDYYKESNGVNRNIRPISLNGPGNILYFGNSNAAQLISSGTGSEYQVAGLTQGYIKNTATGLYDIFYDERIVNPAMGGPGGAVSVSNDGRIVTFGSGTEGPGHLIKTIDQLAVNTTPTYTFDALDTINEGDSITITLNTTNMANGTVRKYTIGGDGITAADFGLTELTGNFTISNNTASVTLDIANDITTEGIETFTITLDDVVTLISKTITIQDTSKFNLKSNIYFINEVGEFTITLTGNLEDGTLVPYTISGITSNDISGALLKNNFIVNNNISTATFNVSADCLTEGTETFTLTLDDIDENISVIINDSSIHFSEGTPGTQLGSTIYGDAGEKLGFKTVLNASGNTLITMGQTLNKIKMYNYTNQNGWSENVSGLIEFNGDSITTRVDMNAAGNRIAIAYRNAALTDSTVEVFDFIGGNQTQIANFEIPASNSANASLNAEGDRVAYVDDSGLQVRKYNNGVWDTIYSTIVSDIGYVSLNAAGNRVAVTTSSGDHSITEFTDSGDTTSTWTLPYRAFRNDNAPQLGPTIKLNAIGDKCIYGDYDALNQSGIYDAGGRVTAYQLLDGPGLAKPVEQLGSDLYGYFNLGLGASVSINDVGNIISAAGPGYNGKGAQRIYKYTGADWVLQQEYQLLNQGDSSVGSGQVNAYIGADINAAGTIAAVGSWNADNIPEDINATGNVRVFLSSTCGDGQDQIWSRIGEDLTGASNAYDVSMNSAGDRIITGDPRHPAAAFELLTY